MAKNPSLVAQLINSSWWLFKVAFLVALAAGGGAAFYYYQHVNDEIRNFAHDVLAKHYKNLKVEIHSAQILKGEGIVIRGVEIKDPQAESSTNVLIHIDEILLACQTDLSDLINGKPDITHITVRRPNLIARCQNDGSWSSVKLLPHPRMGDSPVEVTVEGGTVEVHDARESPASRFVFRDLAVTLTPIEVSKYLNDSAWNIRGSMRGDYLRQFDFSGHIAPFGHTASLSGTVNGLQFNPEFRAALPRDISKILNELNVLNGEINLGFETNYTQANSEPWQFRVLNGKLTEGRIEDQRMHQALNDVTVDFTADEKSFTIEKLNARNGETEIRLAATRYGYTADAKVAVTYFHAANLFIDRKWEKSLPPALFEGLRKFQPAGIVDIDGVANFDGRTWNANGSAECKNISFTFHKFPYRLDRTRGILTMRDNHLSGNLLAYASGRPVEIKCEIDNPGSEFTGNAKISGTDIILDQNVLAAMPAKHREVIETLQPSGSINFNMELNQTVPYSDRPNIDLSINLNRCSLKFTKFQYRIDDVQGEIALHDEKWSFNNLTGVNDTGRIKCSGGISPTEFGDRLDMTIIGTSIPLDEELRDALPEQSRKFWMAIRPSGVIDIDTKLSFLCATHQLDMTITAIPHVAESNSTSSTSLGVISQNQPNTLATSLTGLSNDAPVTQLAPIEEKLKLQNTLVTLEPVFFPLRFEKVRGKMIYRAGKIEFENIQAEHERLPISLSGYAEYDDSGAWHAHFKDLSIERLRIEHPKLQEALPARLRKMLQTARWSGPMSVRGTFDVYGRQDPNWPIITIWDCDVDVRDASFHQGIEVKHLDGSVHLVGRVDGETPRVQGEIYAQSAIVHDMHLTNIRGPLYFDQKYFLLGSNAVPKIPNQSLRHATAKAYGGEVAIDLDVYFDQIPWYRIRAATEGVDLEKFGLEQMPGRQKLAGKVQLGIDVTGNVTGLHTLNGKGGMKLKEAKLYELPVMFAVFNRFRVNDPDRAAFDSGDLSFRIDGEHIYFDSIELSGNTMSLLGTGEMNLNRELQLVFSAVMGRSEWQIPVVKNILSSASQQINEIHVGGTISEPEIKQQPFPGLKEALKQLQADRTQRK